MSDLPVNIDTTYADDGTDASVALHQQHHDSLHALHNAISGATPDPSSVGLADDTPREIRETAQGVWTDDAPAGRSGSARMIIFSGPDAPTDATHGIDTPANIVDGDIWFQSVNYL